MQKIAHQTTTYPHFSVIKNAYNQQLFLIILCFQFYVFDFFRTFARRKMRQEY